MVYFKITSQPKDWIKQFYNKSFQIQKFTSILCKSINNNLIRNNIKKNITPNKFKVATDLLTNL